MWQSNQYQLGSIPFPMSALSDIYPTTKHISDKSRRLEQEGRIIRLKKGLNVRSAEDGAQPEAELIANHLYGPLYVSMQSALRHYGLIPERVYTTQSMTLADPAAPKAAPPFRTEVGDLVEPTRWWKTTGALRGAQLPESDGGCSGDVE